MLGGTHQGTAMESQGPHAFPMGEVFQLLITISYLAMPIQISCLLLD